MSWLPLWISQLNEFSDNFFLVIQHGEFLEGIIIYKEFLRFISYLLDTAGNVEAELNIYKKK